ncbi:MAG: T9SS type A sorting domain-containing protein [Ignavibacteria bacterium]
MYEGLSWTNQIIQTSSGINSIFFSNHTTGYLTVANEIYKTTNGGVGIINISTEIPNEYKLFQNYPNPFNPKTVIRFQLPVASDVSLKVYDVQGREVQTLVNERMQAGTYETAFDGSNLSSGVYFCRIQAGDFTSVKRMVLIK